MSLYAFSNLEIFLNQNNFPQSNGRAFQIIRRNLSQGMQKGDIEIRQDGIFCTIDGYEHRSYIFNQKPNISQWGIPKFHIAECEIVANRKNLHGDYIWTNTEQVQLYDRGQDGQAYPTEDSLTTLKLCSKCSQIVDKQVAGIYTTSDFYEYLTEQYGQTTQPELVQTDIFGYTIDWSMISRRYRATKVYRCERCNIDLSEANAQRYLHVHHRSGLKTDNRPQNLECLCIRCHAAVDQRHMGNFNKTINQRELKAFNERFPK